MNMTNEELDAKLEAEAPERAKRKMAQREEFLDALATYLTRDLVQRSIGLEMGDQRMKEWQKLYGLAGLHGYPTKDEAVAILKDLL